MQTTISSLHEESHTKFQYHKLIPIWSISTKFNKITQLQWLFLVVWGFIGLLGWCGGFLVVKQCHGRLIGNVLVMGCRLGGVELGFQQCGKVGAYNFILAIVCMLMGWVVVEWGAGFWSCWCDYIAWQRLGFWGVSVSAKVMGGGIGLIRYWVNLHGWQFGWELDGEL